MARSLPILVLLAACSSAPTEPSRPANLPKDINQSFKEAKETQSFVKRFERETREVFLHRHRLAAVLALQPGEAVADIGAGTGLFLDLFANDVGKEGAVYAVDIAPKFIEHLRQRAGEKGYTQVRAVHCTDKSTELAANSVDAAFICDTYHHFEYPSATLASLHRALKPGGRLMVVDFERIPGKTREWLLNHVRAGKEVFRAEIEAAGFALVDEPKVRGLEENYVLRFEKK